MAIGKDKRRLIITVPAWVAEEIHALAEEGGASASSLCAEMLTEAVPTFRQLREAIRLAKAKQAAAYDTISEVMAQTIGQASQLQLDAFTEKRKLTRRPTRAHVSGASATEPSAPADEPPKETNTGGRSKRK